MLKSAPKPAARVDRMRKQKTPAGRPGSVIGTSDLLAGFLTWSASRSAQITTTIWKVMPALRAVKPTIIKNYPDAAGLRPGKHRPGRDGPPIDSVGSGGQLGAPPRSPPNPAGTGCCAVSMTGSSRWRPTLGPCSGWASSPSRRARSFRWPPTSSSSPWCWRVRARPGASPPWRRAAPSWAGCWAMPSAISCSGPSASPSSISTGCSP